MNETQIEMFYDIKRLVGFLDAEIDRSLSKQNRLEFNKMKTKTKACADMCDDILKHPDIPETVRAMVLAIREECLR